MDTISPSLVGTIRNIDKQAENYNHLVSPDYHTNALLSPLKVLASTGELSAPRGLKVIEIENFRYDLPPYVRFMNFAERKLNLKYIKREFLWYLRGQRNDTSILEYAKMWSSLVQPDGGINSNYGQYLFAPNCLQFSRIIEILTLDKDSRRATAVILQPHHILTDTTDQPCTYALRFSIRKNKLNMTVHMRSQDAIFGMGNDAPCFSFIHEMVFVKMKEVYPELDYGLYVHFADSYHVYERHFEMLKSLTGVDVRTTLRDSEYWDTEHVSPQYTLVECPKISCGDEVDFLIAGDFSVIPETYQFTKWLVE